MEEIFQACSYLGAYLGTLLGGELLLLTTIIAAKAGYINFFHAMVLAFLGAYSRDLLTFFVGRKSGQTIINKKPALKKKLEKVNHLMEKNPTLILGTYRMLYGFVTIIILMAAISGISLRKFAFLSAISNLIWITISGSLGFICAELMVKQLNFLSQYSGYVIAVLATIGFGYWFFVKRKEIGNRDIFTLDH